MPTGQLTIRWRTVSATQAMPVRTASGSMSASRFIERPRRVNAYSSGGRCPTPSATASGRRDEAAVEDPPPEAVLVQGPTEDRLVDEAQLAEAEVTRQELEADRGVVELAAEAAHRGREDVGMVEGESERRAVLRACGRRVVAVIDLHSGDAEPVAADARDGVSESSGLDERVVRHRDDPRARVAVGRAEREELLDEDVGEPGLVAQDPRGSIVERLVDADEAAGERPAALGGRSGLDARGASRARRRGRSEGRRRRSPTGAGSGTRRSPRGTRSPRHVEPFRSRRTPLMPRTSMHIASKPSSPGDQGRVWALARRETMGGRR